MTEVLLGTDMIQLEDGRRWTCSVCQQEGPWDDSWSGYGTLAMDDVGELIFVTCSTLCRNSSKAQRLKQLAKEIPRLDWTGHRRAGSHKKIEALHRKAQSQ